MLTVLLTSRPALRPPRRRPLAGRMAFFLFTLGIVGTGMLAVPVLAGSAAYAVGEALKWPTGLDRKPQDAKGFYGILMMATLLGLAINFPVVQKHTHLTPIKAVSGRRWSMAWWQCR